MGLLAYVKTAWQNRNIQYPGRFTATKSGGGALSSGDVVTLVASPGTISAAGTATNQTNMNNIEDQVEDITNDLMTASTLGDTTVTAEVTSLASTVLKSELEATVKGRTTNGYDSYTKLLLYFEGTDASTTFTDQTGKTVVASGDAQIDTAQKRWGTSSGLFDGTGDYLTVTGSLSDFNFGTGDFTIEMWVRFNSVASECQLLDIAYTGTTGYRVTLNSPAKTIQFEQVGGSGAGSIATTTVFTTGVWYHLAIVRSSGVVKIYVNGVSENTWSYTKDITNIDDLSIGCLFNHANNFNGWLDELRISNTARYTSTFTPQGLDLLHSDKMRVLSVGKNLFDKSKARIGGYYDTSNSWTASSDYFSTDYIPVVSGQTYIHNRLSSAPTYANYYDANKNWMSSETSITLTIPTNAVYMRMMASYSTEYDILQLEKGSTATSYEPYTSTEAIIPVTLRSVSDTIKDTFDANTGLHTKNISDVVTLSGNTYSFNFENDASGYKEVSFDKVESVSTNSNSVMWKYNNKPLVASGSTATDTYSFDTHWAWLRIPDTDTGWLEAWVSGTSFTTLTWGGLIKAYMNGWKLTTANVDVASCVWTGIASGTTKSGGSGYTDVTTTIDTGFQCYRMIYQLATPIVTNYDPNTLTAEASGTIIVEPFVEDIGLYNGGITIENSSYPISSLSYVYKVDTTTNTEAPVSISNCTVASGGLSFTISTASAGDYYRYGYAYVGLSSIPSLTYDIADSTKGSIAGAYEQTKDLDVKVETYKNELITVTDKINRKLERYGASSAGSDAYVANNTYPAPALYTGMFGSFKADVANTGASTLNYDGLGIKNLKVVTNSGKVDTVTGDLIANCTYFFYYDGTDYVIINPTAVRQSLFTAQGDMAYASGANTWAKLAKATDDGAVLVQASSIPSWLAKGTAYQMLAMNSGATAPVWTNPVRIASGTYNGDNTSNRDIPLGFTPSFLMVVSNAGTTYYRWLAVGSGNTSLQIDVTGGTAADANLYINTTNIRCNQTGGSNVTGNTYTYVAIG